MKCNRQIKPRLYRRGFIWRLRRENPYPDDKNVWGSATVTGLLRNQAYIGNMVQGKRQVLSFKTKKVRNVAKEDWIVVEGTHVPLIQKNLWNRVQTRLEKRYKPRATKKDTIGLFSTMVICEDCSSPLSYMWKPLKDKEIGVYRCSRYNNNGSSACTTHYIQENVIYNIVLNDIRQYTKIAVNERELLTNRLLEMMSNNKNTESRVLQKRKSEAEKRIKVITSNLKKLYEDKCAGTVPENIFQSLMKDFSKEQAELEENIMQLSSQIETIQGTEKDVDEWISMISKHINIETLDRATAMELIESITVSEGKKTDGKRRQEIKIKYRFIGSIPDSELNAIDHATKENKKRGIA